MSAHSPELEVVVYTAAEAAKYLRLKRRTLDRWRTEGKGPRWIKNGHSVLYRREALNAWLLKQERGTTGEPPLRGAKHVDGQPFEAA